MPHSLGLLLLCGGQSGEHSVSLASARSVLDTLKHMPDIRCQLAIMSPKGGVLQAEAAQRYLYEGHYAPQHVQSLAALETSELDVVFPLLHGPKGEDGTVQGWLELLQLPYVGTKVTGSAVCMDKLFMKAVLAQAGIPQVDYRQVLTHEWRQQPHEVLARLQELTLPIFVKPANLGSSVGISKVKHWHDTARALDEAAQYDRRIIVEQGLEPIRELEVAILGNEEARASVVGEIIHHSELYDYQTKYSDGQAELRIPAPLDVALAQRCQAMALQAYQALDCRGLARVDFFLDASQTLWLNEINTMPGFTETSMYPKLWQATGLSYAELLRELLELALPSADKSAG